VGPAEAGRVTSLVRFDPGTSFPSHGHPDGEEVFVLAGTFSDADGEYPAGTYVLNPDGTRHAPWSAHGCTILVRLRQHPGGAWRRQAVATELVAWQPRKDGQSAERPVAMNPDGCGRTSLIRIEPKGRVPRHGHAFGEEVFVLSGELADEFGSYPAGAWIRNPVGSAHAPWSERGCTFLLSTGLPIADGSGPDK
jgi:anti-sigma factor ChrR (cupin superfamily)